MIASLLPGLRELRAPLAAGYVLLLALWLLFDRVVPDPGRAGGVAEPIYRVAGLFTEVGWAVALSFVAYLLGSLSSLLLGGLFRPFLSPPLRPRGRFDPLTPRTRRALGEVAATRLNRLEAQLTFTGSQVDDVLEGPHDADRESAPAKIMSRGPGHARPEEDPMPRQRRRIEAMIIADLDIVGTTRLLGTQPELFAAVDRGRAEVEFRVALAAPVALLGVVTAVRSETPVGLLWLIVGLTLAAGLVLDALRQQRLATGLLVDLLVTDRVQVPSLERSDERARRTSEQDLSEARMVSEQVGRALRTAFASLAIVGTSEPALALEARRLVGEARAAVQEFITVFPDDGPFASLEATVSLLEQAAEGWVAVNEGRPPSAPPKDVAARARRSWLAFVHQVRQSLTALQ